MKWGRKDKPKRPTFITHSPKNVDYSKTPDFIKIADDFVEKFYNGDYAIDLNVFHVPNGDLDKEASLGHFLIVAIRDYIVAKSEKDLKRKEEFADDLLTWLTQAYGLGLIKEGEGMKTKIGRYEQQIQQLKKENQELQKKLILTEKENEDLHEFIDKQFGGTSIAEKP